MTAAEPAGGDARPTSRITVLQAPGKRLTKAFGRDRDGKVVKGGYANARDFLSTEREIRDFDGFAGLLRELQRQPDCCLIRAAAGHWHPGPGRKHRRLGDPAAELADEQGRFQKRELKGTAAAWQGQEIEAGGLFRVTALPMYEERPTDWLLLDIEGIKAPAGVEWRGDLAWTAAYLRLKLPAAFHPVSCVYYATASAADPSKTDLGGDEIRMRLAFLLDRGLTFVQARHWLAGVEGLDTCTLRPVQIIYTAVAGPHRVVRLEC